MTNELLINCPLFMEYIKMVQAYGGGGSPDFFSPVKDFKIPEELKKKCLQIEDMCEEYTGKTFGEVCPDKIDGLETIIPEVEILEYATFPEDGDWTIFLERCPEFKLLDEIFYEGFDGKLSSSVFLDENEREKIIKKFQGK